MLNLTVTLTGNEVEALLEQVRNRIDDNEAVAAIAGDDGFDYNAEVEFWKAIEDKLLA